MKKIIFAILSTIQTKQTRIHHQKNQKKVGQESICHTKFSIKDRHNTKNQNICNANLFAHEKTYIKKEKININFQKYKNQPHQD
ncbi:TPA: polysaccharide deacetylase [Salmonella enterica subsp. enterica serovar Typhisuis]|nr:polysaccharide deacetylase [Salmonella enterica subsp. enterica serovar Typhisuis]